MTMDAMHESAAVLDAATALASVELLHFQPESSRTRQMFTALMASAGQGGLRLSETHDYRGGSDLLLLWGPGAPNRFEAMRHQVKAGGHVLAWDLAYWQREEKFRVSIDAAHPQRWVMRKDWPADRFRADHVAVANRWNPLGPIIVAGLGRKALIQYGQDTVLTWEAEMMQACQRRWSRLVRYRAKHADAPIPAGAVRAAGQSIEQVLDGASLVITWHSNVAVDAIRLGIPVICRDGAAAAVCPSTFGVEDPAPLHPMIRERFLANLAWFQWAPVEARDCWTFLREVLA